MVFSFSFCIAATYFFNKSKISLDFRYKKRLFQSHRKMQFSCIIIAFTYTVYTSNRSQFMWVSIKVYYEQNKRKFTKKTQWDHRPGAYLSQHIFLQNLYFCNANPWIYDPTSKSNDVRNFIDFFCSSGWKFFFWINHERAEFFFHFWFSLNSLNFIHISFYHRLWIFHEEYKNRRKKLYVEKYLFFMPFENCMNSQKLM